MLAREAYMELDLVAYIDDIPLGLEQWRRNVPHFKLITVLKYDNSYKIHNTRIMKYVISKLQKNIEFIELGIE